MLPARFQAIGFMTEQNKGHADMLIVKSTITYAQNGHSVINMTEDGDILVLLISHWRKEWVTWCLVQISKQRRNDQKPSAV